MKKTFVGITILFSAAIIGGAVLQNAKAQDGQNCQSAAEAAGKACESASFKCYDSCKPIKDSSFYECQDACHKKSHDCYQARNDAYDACLGGVAAPDASDDNKIMPENNKAITGDGSESYVIAFIDSIPVRDDMFVGPAVEERAALSLLPKDSGDSEPTQVKLYGFEDLPSRVTVVPLVDMRSIETTEFHVRALQNEHIQINLGRGAAETKIDVAPESEIDLQVFVSLTNKMYGKSDAEIIEWLKKYRGYDDEDIKYIKAFGESEDSLYNNPLVKSQMSYDAVRALMREPPASKPLFPDPYKIEKGFFDYVGDFIEDVADIIVTTVSGAERIQAEDPGAIKLIPVSQEGIAAFERDTDYTFAYDRETRITSVEVYDGSVDVVDLKNGEIIATIQSRYGFPISRVDISSDRTISLKTAIPKSGWPEFVSRHQKNRDGKWVLILMILIIASVGYFVYLKKDAIIKIIKKESKQTP